MKNQSHSQGSSSFSSLHLNSKNCTNTCQNSSKNSEAISKYFTSTKSDYSSIVNLNKSKEIMDGQCSTSAESPYKNSLTEIKHFNINTSANDEKDFKTPKQNLRKNNLQQHKHYTKPKKNINKKLTKKRKTTVEPGQMILTKSVKQNSDNNDVDQEHLELALALSRSLVESRKVENDSDVDYPSTQQKLANVKQTLLQFTYESNTTRMEVSHHRTPVQIKKKTKKSKYQYITPVLYLRTQEDREKLISEKVALILSENEHKDKCFSNTNLQSKNPESEKLQKQWNTENKIFKIKNFPITNNDIFYVKTLQIPTSTTKCGNLLRNWNEIPGREKSPLRETHFEVGNDKYEQSVLNLKTPEENQEDSNEIELHNLNSPPSLLEILENNVQMKSFKTHCISSDLFESEEEMQCKIKESPTNKMSPIIKRSLETLSKIRLQISDESESESLLTTFTPSKRSLNKNVSLHKLNESENRHGSSSSMSDEMFVNDKGICSYESFCKESDNYFDLTQSSDEEIDSVGVKVKTDARSNLTSLSDEILVAISILDDSLKGDHAIITTPSTSRTGVSDILQKSLCLNEESSKSEITRHSKSLNVTEYIYDILNKTQEIFDSKQENLDKNELIDLTQSSSSSSCRNQSPLELLDVNSIKEKEEESNSSNNKNNFQRYESFKSTTSDDLTSSQCSQESICINDEELNYSCMQNRYEFSDGEYETEDDIKNTTPKMTKQNLRCRSDGNKTNELDLEIKNLSMQEFDYEKYTSPIKSKRSLFSNLLDDSFNTVLLENVNESINTKDSNVEPSNSASQNYIKLNERNNTPKSETIIKTTSVTPMTNYDGMDTPKINKELHKFGLKQLKRQRGVQILKHIYETTHPIVSNQNPEQSESDEDKHRVVKKRKSNTKLPASPKKHGKKPEVPHDDASTASNMLKKEEGIEIVGDLMAENETVEDLIFERKQSTKVLSCRVPLHIAWHNLVAVQPELRKNILLYEPLQLEVLYQNLKEQGYKYHIEDLLTFLDKKCITIRTNQSQRRNKRNKKRKSTSPRKSK